MREINHRAAALISHLVAFSGEPSGFTWLENAPAA